MFFDIDRNGNCSSQEFMTQLAKAERLFAQHKERLAGNSTSSKNLRGANGGGGDNEGVNAYIPGYNQSSPRT